MNSVDSVRIAPTRDMVRVCVNFNLVLERSLLEREKNNNTGGNIASYTQHDMSSAMFTQHQISAHVLR